MLISTPGKASLPPDGKGIAAEALRERLFPRRWAVGEDPPDCHSFVERYRNLTERQAAARDVLGTA